MRELWVELGPRRYPIYIGRGLLARVADYLSFLPPTAILLIVTNEKVKGLYGSQVEESLGKAGYRFGWALVPDGEEAKSLAVLGDLYDQTFALGLDRRSAVLALGGGVVGDVAGLLAATYMRGVAFVQLPTTLLAQVDSSVGGKVAINHPQGKNLIGAFYQPRLVVADLDTLTTLPAREWRCGLAEVVKYGVIWDEGLFRLLEEKAHLLSRYAAPQEPGGEKRSRSCGGEARSTGCPGQGRDGAKPPSTGGRALDGEAASFLAEVVWGCCRIKAEVVARDEREEERLRSILNFGHTVGHAVEALTGYERYRHGEAVAMGMVAAGRLAVALGLWRQEELNRLEALLRSLALPVRLPPDLSPEAIVEAMFRDKKAVGGTLTLVLPRRLGEVTVLRNVPVGKVLEVLKGCST